VGGAGAFILGPTVTNIFLLSKQKYEQNCGKLVLSWFHKKKEFAQQKKTIQYFLEAYNTNNS